MGTSFAEYTYVFVPNPSFRHLKPIQLNQSPKFWEVVPCVEVLRAYVAIKAFATDLSSRQAQAAGGFNRVGFDRLNLCENTFTLLV